MIDVRSVYYDVAGFDSNLPEHIAALQAVADAAAKDAIDRCVKWLDAEADRQEAAWNEHILKSNYDAPATSYHTIPRSYAEAIRALKG